MVHNQFSDPNDSNKSFEKYPEWLPRCVREVHNAIHPCPPYVELVERLVSHPDMKHVWREVYKRRQDLCGALLIKIMGCYSVAVEEHKTRRQKAKEFGNFANSMEKLAKEVGRTHLDVFQYFVQYLTPQNRIEERRYAYFTADVLSALAQTARKKAEATLLSPEIISQPNIKRAKQLVFIRDLGQHFKAIFGSYLYRTLATITRVAFDDPEIDESYVKDAFRSWP